MSQRGSITLRVTDDWKKIVEEQAKKQCQTIPAYVKAAVNEKLQRDLKIKQQENM